MQEIAMKTLKKRLKKGKKCEPKKIWTIKAGKVNKFVVQQKFGPKDEFKSKYFDQIWDICHLEYTVETILKKNGQNKNNRPTILW